MVVSHSYKYVFISTPKTGTHSFFKLLQEEFDGERLPGRYHRTDVPKEALGYTIFSTVRNPYDRLVALWNSLLFSKPDKHAYRDTWLSVLRTDDFGAFCKFAAKHKNDIEQLAKVRMPTLMMPQHRWYRHLPHTVIPLHLENISEEFHNLKFVNKNVTIPHALKRDHASWDDLKTEEIIQYANEWAGEDFEKFGYIKE